MKIKAGYRITVVSWENDGDNYATIIRDGLTRAEAQLAVDLLGLLGRKGRFGNMCDSLPQHEEDRFMAAVEPLMQKNSDAAPADWDIEVVRDLLNTYTGCSEYYFTRSVESIVVEEVPHDIYLTDVTSEFIND